ncbi:hypothetical protein BBBOND_0307860 [Babesia bigemina]|uniref:Extracellular matrix-binding ebh n=1 Tax=Babesia bigemina TaxID=5866 RepID=A0A061DA89_BABBI|nr:hypothetical protein BBBOND_0307860 [Babesia bigemina]CDR96882.1 hypothetical protein BBBOND_0307860 [Babesia bigemina]|eukprot:XP_012769068.1 hypothetical protein BBBOND_0307860 [Babesia bigemina]
MAPKALTDCPENLREAIDWLVQVRHCGGVSTLSDALCKPFHNVVHNTEGCSAPKDSENPHKNIIHNLCASAASLLGYRYPGTYDGSGIVYGNASRLCDAILVFLYAVFSDVHDNQPYVAGRDVLHDVIVELKSQLWRGHKGFCHVIPKVATGLQRYNAAVEASNKKVKEPIETVLDYLKPDGELRKGIQALQISETSTSTQDERTVESAVSLVERCKEIARAFSKSLMAATDAIDDLNPKLKKKLENARKSFFNHVDWLSRWSKKGQKKMLDKMIQKIKNRLKQLANAVKDKIRQEVHTVVELLKDRVKEIKMKLEGIAASLEKYVKELGQWMGDAKEYINAVKKYVEEIMKQLDGENRQAIDKAVADIDSELGKRVEELNQWIETADSAVTVAKQKADEVHKRLDKGDKNQKIGQGLQKIEAARSKVESVSSELKNVHSDLVSWKDAAEGVLRKVAGKADEVSGQLDPSQKGDGNPIGKNLNQIDASNEDIKKANESLRKQTEKLNKWITEADEIRKKAQDKAEEVYKSLTVHKELSDKIGEIQTANQTIKDVNSGLGDVDSKLGEWKKEAGRVLQGVVDRATEVHKKLNKDDLTNDINVGISQINAAKDAIAQVDKGLKSVNDDLQKWRKAAQIVLDIAVNRAEDVHEKLDPAKDKSTLGGQIDAIDTARQGIVDANKELAGQLKSLNKWIQDAEDIRHKAETKAREAYDKLSVHEKLSENVKKIMDAKEKIEGVNKNVTSQLVTLNQWNEKAKEVITGAVGKAQEVHDALQEGAALSRSVKGIATDNASMIEANKKLATEVQNLGKWKDAAKDVIKKAEDKCGEIVEKVKTSKDSMIFAEASKLKDQGIKLLKAATEARQTVESKVKEALDAVKDMDADLKRDLKVVKDNIKLGIAEVIESLKVGDLGDKVKEDLVKLRERIMKLAENGRVESLVEKELAELNQKKSETLDHAKQKLTEAEKQLQSMFESAIKTPLDDKVKTVENAIEKLYEKINPDGGDASREDKKKFQTIFDHIKKQVGVIKGTGTKSHESGIDGIVANVRGLYNAFVDSRGSGVDDRVDGWLGNILGINENQRKTQTDGMKAVTSWINVYNGKARKLEDTLKIVKDQIKGALSDQIDTGQRQITRVDAEDNIVQNLTKVKEACRAFAEALDAKLTNIEINNFTGTIVSDVQSRFEGQRRRSSSVNENLKTAVRAGLIALCSCVRQIAIEIESLAINKFGRIIDKIKPTVDGLNDKLVEATTPHSTGEANPDPGTAQAVDKAIEGVKKDVDGLDDKFKQEVKQPLDTAVKELEGAVDTFNEQAKQQVRDAAKGAIDQAAKQISDNGRDIKLSKNGLMQHFNGAYNSIKSNLPKDLQGLLDKHIGKDEVPYVGIPYKVKLSKDFDKYLKHVSAGVLTGHPHGPLAEAIDKIGGEGMKELGVIHPRHIGNDKIDEQTFENPFKAIQLQLEDITKLVSDIRTDMTGEPASYRNGIKNYLEQLRKALGDGKLAGAEKGLDAITKAIGKLQRNTFGPKSGAIGIAVEEMRKEIEELKEKLLSEQDSKDDVINALTYLQKHGLASETWNGKYGNPVDGLKKIEDEFNKQNGALLNQTHQIETATRIITNEIQDALRRVGMKLNHTILDDDVVDKLEALQFMIGVGGHGGLQGIFDVINQLWVKQFSEKPKAIQGATGAIRRELKQLQSDLQGDRNYGVIETLRDLRDVGLSKNVWQKYDNTKGLEAIEEYFKRHQEVFSQQPRQIESGVKDITEQLEGLRTALKDANGHPKDDVINRLGELLVTGLNGTEWNIGKGKKTASLGQIKKDLRGQNDKLAAANKKIEDATNTVMSETQDMLRKASQKLSGDLISDTIVKNLQLLEKMIGSGQNGDSESLQAIQKVISGLQAQQFDVKFKTIGEAKQNIEQALTAQKTALQNEVTNPLKELMEQGLGDGKNWNGKNAKGFDHIKRNLQSQQSDLSKHPEQIDLGMKDITN